MKEKVVKMLSKIGSLMSSEEFVNKLFKIGVLLIGVGFLVVYFFHSQNGRFHKIGDADDMNILDTRTGTCCLLFEKESGKLSLNPITGKAKADNTPKSEWNYIPPAPATLGAAPPAPGAPPAPSAQDFLKGK